MDTKEKVGWTPGPWSFFDGGLDGFGIQDGSASGPRLAHVRYERMSGGKCEGYEVAKANALLISKAPEMAELLRDVSGHVAGELGERIEKLLAEIGA